MSSCSLMIMPGRLEWVVYGAVSLGGVVMVRYVVAFPGALMGRGC